MGYCTRSELIFEYGYVAIYTYIYIYIYIYICVCVCVSVCVCKLKGMKGKLCFFFGWRSCVVVANVVYLKKLCHSLSSPAMSKIVPLQGWY